MIISMSHSPEPLLPVDQFDGTRKLLVLDFDGVINRFNNNQGPVRKRVRTAHGRSIVPGRADVGQEASRRTGRRAGPCVCSFPILAAVTGAGN
jgi:hypothetical protein